MMGQVNDAPPIGDFSAFYDSEQALAPKMGSPIKPTDLKMPSLSGIEKAIQDSIGIDAIKDATGVTKGDVYTHYYGDGVVRPDSQNKIKSF